MKNWADRLKKGIHDNPEAAGGELQETRKTTTALAPKKVKKNFFSRLRRESKRDRQLSALTDGYQQLVGLMGSIQMHLESQAKNQQQLLGALESLPEVAEGLKKMGTAAEKQTEVMGLMRDQLDSSIQHDRQLAKSMNRFNGTLAVMNVIFLVFLLSGLSFAIYFSLNDSAQRSLTERVAGLFEKESASAGEIIPNPKLLDEEPPAPLPEDALDQSQESSEEGAVEPAETEIGTDTEVLDSELPPQS